MSWPVRWPSQVARIAQGAEDQVEVAEGLFELTVPELRNLRCRLNALLPAFLAFHSALKLLENVLVGDVFFSFSLCCMLAF